MVFTKAVNWQIVFTLQSIKSRIETESSELADKAVSEFLLYSPLNQGLKLRTVNKHINIPFVFTLQSIKSRIETEKKLH